MQQLNVKQIETERLLLKRFTPADFIFTFKNYSEEGIRQIFKSLFFRALNKVK